MKLRKWTVAASAILGLGVTSVRAETPGPSAIRESAEQCVCLDHLQPEEPVQGQLRDDQPLQPVDAPTDDLQHDELRPIDDPQQLEIDRTIDRSVPPATQPIDWPQQRTDDEVVPTQDVLPIDWEEEQRRDELLRDDMERQDVPLDLQQDDVEPIDDPQQEDVLGPQQDGLDDDVEPIDDPQQEDVLGPEQDDDMIDRSRTGDPSLPLLRPSVWQDDAQREEVQGPLQDDEGTFDPSLPLLPPSVWQDDAQQEEVQGPLQDDDGTIDRSRTGDPSLPLLPPSVWQGGVQPIDEEVQGPQQDVQPIDWDDDQLDDQQEYQPIEHPLPAQPTTDMAPIAVGPLGTDADALGLPDEDIADRHVIAVVLAADGAENDAAGLAIANARDPAVKAYAERLKAHHKTDMQKVADTSRRLRATVTDSQLVDKVHMDAKQNATKLSQLSGDAFDRAWVDTMVMDHTKTLAMIDDRLLPEATTSALRAHLREMRGLVAAHLEEARTLQQSLKTVGQRQGMGVTPTQDVVPASDIQPATDDLQQDLPDNQDDMQDQQAPMPMSPDDTY